MSVQEAQERQILVPSRWVPVVVLRLRQCRGIVSSCSTRTSTSPMFDFACSVTAVATYCRQPLNRSHIILLHLEEALLTRSRSSRCGDGQARSRLGPGRPGSAGTSVPVKRVDFNLKSRSRASSCHHDSDPSGCCRLPSQLVNFNLKLTARASQAQLCRVAFL
eukprot:1815179-Rhodomonas_salina.1